MGSLSCITFGTLETEKQYELLKNCFYYSHLQLAALLMPHCPLILPKQVFEWFEEALKSDDAATVNVLGDQNLLFMKNEKGETLLHLAVKDNAIEFVKVLLARGIHKDQRDQSAHTAYPMRKTTRC